MVTDLGARARAKMALDAARGDAARRRGERGPRRASALWEPVTYSLSKQISSSFPVFSPGDLLRLLVGPPRRDLRLRELPAVREALPRHHGAPEPLLREARPAREDGDVRHREGGRGREASASSKIEDFTWKQKLDIFTCTECGRCREVCPTHLTGKPLTPKGFMVDLRNALYTDADDAHRRRRGPRRRLGRGGARGAQAAHRRLDRRGDDLGLHDVPLLRARVPGRASRTSTRSPTCAATSSSRRASSRRRRRRPSTAWSARATRGTSPPRTATRGRRTCRSRS